MVHITCVVCRSSAPYNVQSIIVQPTMCVGFCVLRSGGQSLTTAQVYFDFWYNIYITLKSTRRRIWRAADNNDNVHFPSSSSTWSPSNNIAHQVLITKLRSANTIETRQYRKASKALLVLLPLLGITYLVVLAGPNEGVGSHIFGATRAVLLSTQVNERNGHAQVLAMLYV